MLQVSAIPLGLIGGWLTATPATGNISADGQATVSLKYDFSNQEFQGTNKADLLITTSGQPAAKASTFLTRLTLQPSGKPLIVSSNLPDSCLGGPAVSYMPELTLAYGLSWHYPWLLNN